MLKCSGREVTAVRVRFKGKELMKAMGYKNSRAFAAALLGVRLCPDCGAELTCEDKHCSCGWSQAEFEERCNEIKEDESCVRM